MLFLAEKDLPYREVLTLSFPFLIKEASCQRGLQQLPLFAVHRAGCRKLTHEVQI